MKLLPYLLLFFFSLNQAQNIEFNLYFDLGKYDVRAHHKKSIAKKLALLDSTKQYNFMIQGFTDYVDTESFNMELSKNRATAVSNYLQKKYNPFINSIESEARGELPMMDEEKYKLKGFRQHRKVSVIISKNDHIPVKTKQKESIYAVPIKKLKIGSSYSLGKINFKMGRTTLIKSSKKELEKLVRFLKRNRTVHIEIQGHICCGGNTDYDAINSDTGTRTLSVDRAEFIYSYLINRGISAKRLSYAGYAFTSPLRFPEKGKKDRASNRRVEIKIVKK